MYRIAIYIFFYILTTGYSYGHMQSSSITADSVLFESETLILKRLSDGTLQHISYLNVDGFGKVDCNGVVVISGKQALILDSPANSRASRVLLDYLQDTLDLRIEGVVATHFHQDCIGGLDEFHQAGIASYAHEKTVKKLKESAHPDNLPQHAISDQTVLKLGEKNVILRYTGPGHSMDNIVAYYPAEQVLFGGCLVKALGAGKGNLSDAEVSSWTSTVEALEAAFPEAKIIVPGHGSVGDRELLQYTADLFRNDALK